MNMRIVGQSLIQLVVTVALMGIMLFGAAGTIDWPRAWWFLGAGVMAICIIFPPLNIMAMPGWNSEAPCE